MKMLKVMEKRRTVRVYDGAPLSEAVMGKIQTMIESMPVFAGTESVQFTVLENGETVYEALDGIVGYNGIMINAPHYFLVTCDCADDYQVIGFLGEWLALHLAKENIGTCWLTCTGKTAAIKEALSMEFEGEVAAMIAFGEPNEDKKLSRIYDFGSGPVNDPNAVGSGSEATVKDENYAFKKAITEIVYLKTFGNEIDAEEIGKRGMDEVFYYMRNAPSWGNIQPWKFILDGERVVLTMELNPAIDLEVQKIDAGVAMLYFEVAMHDRGLGGKWHTHIDGIAEKCQVPATHRVAGYYA